MSLTRQNVCSITCEEHVGRPARTNFALWVADCVAILREHITWEVKR